MRLVEIGKAKEGSPLAGLADDIERNEAPWKEFAALEAPEAALMPSDLTAKLSLFEQLLVSLPHLPYQLHLELLVYVLNLCEAPLWMLLLGKGVNRPPFAPPLLVADA